MRAAPLHGGLAAGAALVAIALARLASPGLASPPLALAERLVRVAPGDVATFFIERLGDDALPLLSLGSAAALVSMGGLVAGIAARLRPGWPVVAAAVSFTAVLAAAGLASPVGPGMGETLAPALAGGAAYAAALAGLRLRGRGPGEVRSDPSRRAFLVRAATAAGGLVVAGGLLAAVGRLLERAAGEVRLAAPARPAARPARAPFPDVDGLGPEVTPVSEHYVVDINTVEPVVDAASWRLVVDGLVARPLSLGTGELQAGFEVIEEVSVLTCVSNKVGGPLVDSSAWTGVRLDDVLRAAGPRRRARSAVFSCADGYTVTVPVAALRGPHALLALGQNGRPLTRAHGSPCRVRLPALYGMMNAKWVERVTLVSGAPRGYWARRGWSRRGIVRTQSRIDTSPGSARVGEPVWIAGVAWAGERGVGRVEVTVDGGRTWQEARLRRPLSAVAWSQWALRWTPERPGPHEIACRATDGTGRAQPARRSRPHPDGATGYDVASIDVRKA